MKTDRYVESLRKVSIFQALSNKELASLSRLAERVDIEEGYLLTKEGTTGHEFFVIESGSASVLKGKRKIAALGPGDFFGELALLDQCPRNATVRADSPMKVVVLGHREFMGLLGDVPTVSIKLLKGMARRLRDADTKAYS